MSRLDLELLGEFRVRFDGAPWRFGAPPKCPVLLALLLLSNGPLNRASLASTLWPDDDDQAARANLRRHLHALSHALPKVDGVAWIVADTNTVAWNPDSPMRSDLREFLALSSETASRATATSLYRGDLLSGCFDEAILAPRERLASLRLELLSELAREAHAVRDFAGAIDYAERILAVDEWREDIVRLVMRARASSGDRSGALAAYARFSRRLLDELQTEPMFDTVALRDAIASDALPADDAPLAETAKRMRLMVGRDEHLAQLSSHWLRAARGSGTTVFVSGEPGIGKSRLAHELLGVVAAQGGRALFGRTSQPESTPYQPLVDALRQAVPFVRREERDDRWLAALAPLLPEIERLHDAGPALASLEAEQARVRLHDACFRAFAASSRVRPLAIVLEDLHWASRDTVDAVGTIAEALAAVPILLVITYRTTDAAADSAVRILRRRLARESLAHHVALGRIGAEDVARIVASAGSRDCANEVYRISEGNPLFVWQLIEDHRERGPAAESLAAQTVHDVIRARLDHIDAVTRAVAEVAATIGDSFTIEEIADVGGWDESSAYAALAKLLDRHIVAERAGASFEYGFTHMLIATTIYDAMPEGARTVRHRRAAEVLSRTRLENGRSVRLVGQHWERAGEWSAARETYLKAASLALAAFARDESIELADRVLSLDPSHGQRFAALMIRWRAESAQLDAAARAKVTVDELQIVARNLGPEQRFEALAARVQLYDLQSERAAQQEAIDQMLALADSVERRARAHLAHAKACLQRGDTAEAIHALRTIEGTIDDVAPAMRFEFHEVLARALFRATSIDDARRELCRFRSYLDEHPSLDGEFAYATAELAGAWIAGNAPALQACAHTVVRLAEQRGDALGEAHGRAYLAYARNQLQDTAGAREEYRRTLELFLHTRHTANVLITRFNYGMVEYEAGHVDRAAEQWGAVSEAAPSVECTSLRIGANINLAEIALRRHDVRRALAHADAAFEEALPLGDTWMIDGALCVRGAARVRCGSIEAGLADLKSVVDAARRNGRTRALLSYLTCYIEELTVAERTEDLDGLIDELAAATDAAPADVSSPGLTYWVLASAARARGRDELAQQMSERGREAVEKRAAMLDDEDRAAYRSMFPHPLLLARVHATA